MRQSDWFCFNASPSAVAPLLLMPFTVHSQEKNDTFLMFEQKTKWETCQIEFCECCVAFKCFAQCYCSNIIDTVVFVFNVEESEWNETLQNCVKQTLQVKCRECCVWFQGSTQNGNAHAFNDICEVHEIMVPKEWVMTHLFDAWIVLQTCDSSKLSHMMHKSWCFRFLEDSKNNRLLVKHRFCSFPFWTLTVEFIKRKLIHPSNFKD